MITFYPNLVLLKILRRANVFASNTFLSSTKSTLFRTTMIFFMKSSAMITHSAVWACIPLVTSMIRNMMSIIWAPPMIVLIREACPGQSTSVNCKYSSLICWSNLVGTLVKKAEKPRSRVIPLYWDCGFLSRLAVEVISLRILQMEVLPESTCPSTPTLIFTHLLGWIEITSSLLKSKRSFYIKYIRLLIWVKHDFSMLWMNRDWNCLRIRAG